jgi:Kef-type K+ transport system membrane component KefB
MEISYGDVLLVVVAAVLAPVLAGLAPRLRMPAVALEILLGVLIGPSVLDIVEVDTTVDVLSTLGLGYLLFLAGLELDLTNLRGKSSLVFGSWGVSCVLALVFALGVHLLDAADTPLIVAIALTSTSLGLVVPILREASQHQTTFGQTVMGASSVAEFGSLLLLTVFFSTDGSDTGKQIVLIVIFAVAALLLALAVAQVSNVPSVWPALERLAEGSSQLSVRAVLVVFLVFLALATHLGLEAILGAFVAGALLKFLDREGHLDNPSLKPKVDAIGYGFLVPIFFVATGVQLDMAALFDSPKHLVLVPVLAVGMLVVRGIPTWIMIGRSFSSGESRAAALLSSTNLTLVVVVSSIGVATGDLDPPSSAALVMAGVVSVLLYPPAAMACLPRSPKLDADWDEPTD